MKIDILTLFPEMFEQVLGSSIIGKAADKGLVQFRVKNFREYAVNKHGQVDDYPYGGGPGMVLRPEPLFAAVEELTKDLSSPPRVLLMCPQGERYDQRMAEQLAKERHLVFICGHYEGYDERIREHLITDEISIGDFILTGGELPAMTIIDSIVRLLPGALGNESSAVTDSFSDGLLEHPHYTRPATFRGWSVPEVLLSGHHAKIEEWRREQSVRRTLERRPELLEKIRRDPAWKQIVERVEKQLSREKSER